MALAKIVYASMTGNTEERETGRHGRNRRYRCQKIGRIGSHCRCRRVYNG